MAFKGGKRNDNQKAGSGKHSTKGGVQKNKHHNKNKYNKKAKAAAPTTDELDQELRKYMGEEYVAKKLDSELDAYFKSGGDQ